MRKARKYSSTVVQNVLDSIDKGEYARIESRMTISAMIANRIKELGISKIQFSVLMDVQPSIITRWLSGTHNFTIDTISDIQSKLDIVILNTSNPKPQTYIGRDHAVILLQLTQKVTESDAPSIFKIPKSKEENSSINSGSLTLNQISDNSISNFKPCSNSKSSQVCH